MIITIFGRFKHSFTIIYRPRRPRLDIGPRGQLRQCLKKAARIFSKRQNILSSDSQVPIVLEPEVDGGQDDAL